MELPEFRRRFNDTELSCIYADPNAGGVLKDVLRDVHSGDKNLIQAADEAVIVCRDRFASDVDPLFVDRDFLYAFLSTWMREDSFHSRFVDEEFSMLFFTSPALCYAIYDHGKWISDPTEGWMKCAETIAWDGVMPIDVLHRGKDGFQSRMVAYRNSPIWDYLGFSGRKIDGVEVEPFPFESDWKVSRGLFGVSKVEIRKMYVRVGLPDPKKDIEEVMRHVKVEHCKDKAIKLSDDQRAALQSWRADKDERDDRRVFEPDPPSFDPPPPQKAPDRSYAYDNALKESSEAKRIIDKHARSIAENSLLPMLKMYSQMEYMRRSGDPALSTEAALELNARIRTDISKLINACNRLAEIRIAIESKMLWLHNQKLPTSLDDWADFEQSMYDCSIEVSELHAEASNIFKTRVQVKELQDAIGVSIGRLRTVRKSAIAKLLLEAKLMFDKGEVEKGFCFLIGAAASGDSSIFQDVADRFEQGIGVVRDEVIGRAFRLASKGYADI